VGDPAESGRRSVDPILRQVLDQGYQSRHIYPHGQILPNFGSLAEMWLPGTTFSLTILCRGSSPHPLRRVDTPPLDLSHPPTVPLWLLPRTIVRAAACLAGGGGVVVLPAPPHPGKSKNGTRLAKANASDGLRFVLDQLYCLKVWM
jgi:hypothetical protein